MVAFRVTTYNMLRDVPITTLQKPLIQKGPCSTENQLASLLERIANERGLTPGVHPGYQEDPLQGISSLETARITDHCVALCWYQLPLARPRSRGCTVFFGRILASDDYD
jgi:hypothetical protein